MDENAPEPSPFGPGNPARPTLLYILLRFLRYGVLAWGGPVAQIGLMHRELVERDGWITQDRFRKTLALYQALPGPEAHELAVYFGMIKRGRVGGFLAGLGFMLPGVLLVTLAAFLYVQYSQTSTVADAVLYGVRPAVVALVAVMFVHLLRRAVPTRPLLLVSLACAVVGVALPSVNFLLILAASGLIGSGLSAVADRAAGRIAPGFLLPALAASFPALGSAGILSLALINLKVGFLTFGGAYTAIPFLHQGVVVEQRWLTDDQFLDALALSGVLPAPLISVGTFIGYQVAGPAGAALATALIFGPAFGFTLVGHRFFERLIHHERLHAFLLGVTAGVVGLVATSLVPLSVAAITDVYTGGLGAGAALAIHSRKVPTPLVILASGATGALVHRLVVTS